MSGSKEGKRRSKNKKAVDLEKLTRAKPTKLPGKGRTETGTGSFAPPVNWKMFWGALALAAIIAFIAHVNTMTAGLVFADRVNVLGALKVEDWSNLSAALLRDAFMKPLSQPWVRASYALDFMSYKTAFTWYHGVNVVVHTFSTIFLFVLSWRLFRLWHVQERINFEPAAGAFATAAIFAAHPLTCEPVAYLSARSALLATNNCLLSMTCFLLALLARGRAVRIWMGMFCILAAAMAVTSGAEALVLPALMLLLYFAVKRPGMKAWIWAADHPFVVGILLFLSLTLPYVVLLDVKHPEAINFAVPALPANLYWAAQPQAFLAYYLRCFLVPVGLSIDPQVSVKSIFNPLTIAGVLAIAGIIAISVKLRSRPYIWVGVAMTLLGFMPHALIPQPQVVADSAFYLPLAGLALVAGGLLATLSVDSMKRASIVVALLVLALIGATVYRNTEWNNDVALWRSTTRANPDSMRAQSMLSVELSKQGKYDEAKQHAEQALKIDEKSPLSWVASGTVALGRKQYEQAEKSFGKAHDLLPDVEQPRDVIVATKLGLAESYVRQSKPDLAVPLVYQIIEDVTGDFRSNMILGLANFQQKNYQRAFFYLQMSVQQNPRQPELWPVLTQCALELNLYDQAIQAAQTAVSLEPTTANKLLFARALFASFRNIEGKAILKDVLDKEPDNAEALTMMYMAERRSGNKSQADKLKKEALAQDADALKKYSYRELEPEQKDEPPPPASKKRRSR